MTHFEEAFSSHIVVDNKFPTGNSNQQLVALNMANAIYQFSLEMARANFQIGFVCVDDD